MLFTECLPLRYKVLETQMRIAPSLLGLELLVRTREYGPLAQSVKFLLAGFGRSKDRDIFRPVTLPRILLKPHDPPDSEELQWSFWQGLRVGGAIDHDVFDVTHLQLDGF